MRTLVLAALIPLALAACASNVGPSASQERMDQLQRDCEARGGRLVPSGRLTGEEALDFPCRIRDATNLPPRG